MDLEASVPGSSRILAESIAGIPGLEDARNRDLIGGMRLPLRLDWKSDADTEKVIALHSW
jgi:hypothetical protein